ncbi:MAG: YaiO family outer membrane beta-barrel protein [Gammaproteobacteria bacterium]
MKSKRNIAGIVTTLLIFTLLRSHVACAAENELNESNYYELGVGYYDLTAGFESWKEAYARGSWQQNQDNVWQWEVLTAERFNESGTYVSGSLTHVFNSDWYGSLHLGTSDDVFFFPRYRVDAFLNRKFLEEKNLIGTIGVYQEDTRQENEESGFYLGATYYFPSPWILEVGTRKVRSLPGPEYSSRYKLAVTYGSVFDRYIIAQVDWGNEAYQLVSATITPVNIDSTVYSLTWREWIKKDWGTNIMAEYYTSDTYDRKGVMFGVFKHF